jgi:hypothetical protein
MKPALEAAGKNQTRKLDVLSNDDSTSYERSFESETAEITTPVLFSAAREAVPFRKPILENREEHCGIPILGIVDF